MVDYIAVQNSMSAGPINPKFPTILKPTCFQICKLGLFCHSEYCSYIFLYEIVIMNA